MAAEPVNSLLEYLHRMAQEHEYSDASDGSLLEQFVTERNESAFAALVQRHGQMVWGVCRRLLHSHHDTEDAFQATFLILALKASSIVPRGMVANWLYGVASRTALKARAIATRRRKTEMQVNEMPVPIEEESVSSSDIRSLIDDELSRLPDRHRAVVVLCDLEGNSRSEAARHLGVPEGTIAGWLARGRAKLAQRLSQRGVVLSGSGLALVHSHSAASDQIPVALMTSTTQAAYAFAAQSATATGTISPPAIVLTRGVLKSMFFQRFKLPLACLAICVVSAVGMNLTHFAAAGQDDTKRATPEQPVKEQSTKKLKVDEATNDLTFQLKGKWINVDERSVGPKRIVVENKDDNDKTHQGWTVITPVLVPTVDRDWEGEKLKLHMLLEPGGGNKDKRHFVNGFATWESKERDKKRADYHMTFRMEGELLVVDTYAIYTGDFFPQHWRCEYKKEK